MSTGLGSAPPPVPCPGVKPRVCQARDEVSSPSHKRGDWAYGAGLGEHGDDVYECFPRRV